MHKKLIYIYFIIFFACVSVAKPQKIDSLRQLLKTSKNKSEIFNKISSEFIHTSKDSAIKYANTAFIIAKKENNLSQIALALKTLGTINFYKGKIDKALQKYAESLDFYKKTGDNEGVAAIMHNIGTMYNVKGETDKAIKYFDSAIKYELKNGNIAGCAKTYNNIGVLYQQQSKYNLAEKYYKKALESHKKTNNKQGLSKVYNNLGNIALYKNNYDDALNYYFKSLEIKLKLDDKNAIAITYNNIGMVSALKGKYDIAISYYLRALNIFELTGNNNDKAETYNKIGNVYISWNKLKKAKNNFFTAIKILKKTENKKALGRCYNNLGLVYSLENNNELALQYYLHALQIFSTTESSKELSNIYLNIGDIYYLQQAYNDALFYMEKAYRIAYDNNFKLELGKALNAMSKTYYQQNNLIKSFNFLLKSIDINKQIKNSELLINNYETLRDIYLQKHDYKNAYFSYKNYITLRDSIFNIKTHKQITELQTKYDTEKKQKEIQLLQTKEKAKNIIIKKNNETITYQKTLIFISLIAVIIILLFAIMLRKQVKQKQLANKKLKEQQQQVLEKNEELNQQNAEIMAQRDEITNQRDLLQEQKKEITDSINYAKHIQTAILISDNEIQNIFDEYFVLYKPKDIVSGDFYWFSQNKNYKYFAAIDCTGHGVPGAFLSIIGKKSLDKSINENNLSEPAKILDSLNNDVYTTFHKKNSAQHDIKDGMDLALCRIDYNKMGLVFAGANNPAYILRNNEIIILKGDKQAIGINRYNKEKYNFSQTKFDLQKNDIIYVFSDGYADQFGGDKGKKLKYKEFRKLLMQKTDNLKIQKEFLETELTKWQNNFPQIDDILVIGVKI